MNENSGTKTVRIINLSGYNSHTVLLFKQLNLLEIDQLKLQEIKFYFKYIHRNVPVYY